MENKWNQCFCYHFFIIISFAIIHYLITLYFCFSFVLFNLWFIMKIKNEILKILVFKKIIQYNIVKYKILWLRTMTFSSALNDFLRSLDYLFFVTITFISLNKDNSLSIDEVDWNSKTSWYCYFSCSRIFYLFYRTVPTIKKIKYISRNFKFSSLKYQSFQCELTSGP